MNNTRKTFTGFGASSFNEFDDFFLKQAKQCTTHSLQFRNKKSVPADCRRKLEEHRIKCKAYKRTIQKMKSEIEAHTEQITRLAESLRSEYESKKIIKEIPNTDHGSFFQAVQELESVVRALLSGNKDSTVVEVDDNITEHQQLPEQPNTVTVPVLNLEHLFNISTATTEPLLLVEPCPLD
ncbi:hypothetical protein COEREDRAFT_86505 [Coemansia reversa NRRL 1564]|uniref:Uncharacterized protein n=1 Tax=Coemansia reversa (strain ATCC 12441 / NRRL 1564) TaxID=763665 RepID=A0A2G5BDL5_COERN|nr:hypothetical protein COEREDRAFT_86505 [Coemansia reversa NRRL 1564]|eukprot:PIA17108.1 hypothetical protein COEREDRAFT_86505 [Coemansia reversa NRRL 1564]